MSFAGIRRESLNGIKGTARTVLVTILVECNHTDNPDFLLDNKIFPIKRGQWVASAKRISELTGLTRQQVRNALNTTTNLTITRTIRATSKATLYAIDNIDKYLVKQNEQPADQPPQQHSRNQQLTTNNKDTNKEPNKEKNKKEVSVKKSPMDLYLKLASFEEFWNSYGLKTGRAKCEVSYNKAIKSGVSHETIMLGVKGYQAQCIKRELTREFIKNPLTWLNGKHWDDEYERELTREEKLREIDDLINAKKNNNLQITGAR